MAGSIKVAGMPVRATLVTPNSWRTTMREDGEVTFDTERAHRGELLASSAWAVRDEFLNITEPEDAQAFLQRYGPLVRKKGDEGLRLAPQESCGISMKTLIRHQGWLLTFIEANSPAWLEGGESDLRTDRGLETFSRAMAFNSYRSPVFTLEMGFAAVRGKKEPSPFLSCETSDAWDAVSAATYIDKMRGLRGAVCQRDGCTKTFIAGDPRKRFCSDSCGANVRVTEARKRQRVDHDKA